MRFVLYPIVLLAWVVMGFAIWVRLLIGAAASYTIAHLQAALSGSPVAGANDALKDATLFWVTGFTAIHEGVFGDPATPPAERRQVRFTKSWARLALEAAWTVFFWLMLLWSLGLTPGVRDIVAYVARPRADSTAISDLRSPTSLKELSPLVGRWCESEGNCQEFVLSPDVGKLFNRAWSLESGKEEIWAEAEFSLDGETGRVLGDAKVLDETHPLASLTYRDIRIGDAGSEPRRMAFIYDVHYKTGESRTMMEVYLVEPHQFTSTAYVSERGVYRRVSDLSDTWRRASR